MMTVHVASRPPTQDSYQSHPINLWTQYEKYGWSQAFVDVELAQVYDNLSAIG
jgi:hypothetical protein